MPLEPRFEAGGSAGAVDACVVGLVDARVPARVVEFSFVGTATGMWPATFQLYVTMPLTCRAAPLVHAVSLSPSGMDQRSSPAMKARKASGKF